MHGSSVSDCNADNARYVWGIDHSSFASSPLRPCPPLPPQSVLGGTLDGLALTLDKLDQLIHVEVSPLAYPRPLLRLSRRRRAVLHRRGRHARLTGASYAGRSRTGRRLCSESGRSPRSQPAAIGGSDSGLRSAESLELTLLGLLSGLLLLLDILDHRREQLHILGDLLGLGVLLAQASLENLQSRFRGLESLRDVASQEVSLGELVQRLTVLDVVGTEDDRRLLLSLGQESERQHILVDGLENDTGVALSSVSIELESLKRS
jgi:hypothetical protein